MTRLLNIKICLTNTVKHICSFPTGLEIQRGLLLRNVWGRYCKDVPSQIPGSFSTEI